MTARPIIRLLTCGSVDDGKSTLIGRLDLMMLLVIDLLMMCLALMMICLQ